MLAKLKEFQAKFGDDFKPAALLEKLAAEGGAFSRCVAAVPHPAGCAATFSPRGKGSPVREHLPARGKTARRRRDG